MISTGTYDTLPLMQCVASAKMFLRIEVSDEDIYFEKLANEAARHMDNLNIFIKKQCRIEVVNGKAKLPHGFYRLLGLKLNGLSNCATLFYVDQPFLESCGCGISAVSGINGLSNIFNSAGAYQIQNGHIFFSTGIGQVDADGNVCQINSVDLAYISLMVDDEGLMVVRPDMERGITAYICYMYMMQYPEKYPVSIWNEQKQIWMAQKEWVKSNDIQNRFRDTRRQVASIANAWVTSKNWWT